MPINNKPGKSTSNNQFKNNKGKNSYSRFAQSDGSSKGTAEGNRRNKQKNRFSNEFQGGSAPRKSRTPAAPIPESRAYNSASKDRGYESASRSNRQYDAFARQGAKSQNGGSKAGRASFENKPGFGKPSFEKVGSPASRRFGPDSGGMPRNGAAVLHKSKVSPVADLMTAADEAKRYEDDIPQVNLLTGRNPIREAIKTGRDLEKLMIAKGELSGSAREIVSLAKKAGVMIQSVERSRLDQLAKNHQGMIAFASAYQYCQVEDILETARQRGEAPFIIVLDQVTDPHNLGAVIRTAACAGAHGVIVPMHRAVGLTPAAVKASAGAVEHIKVARVVNLNQTIKNLQKQGIWFYAASMDGEDYRKVRFEGPCALVIGSEGEGVSQLTSSICDKQIKIPMRGEMNSLNASVAAGILMYAVYGTRNPVV